jgi:asparagine synthetase B (glutamine-hydrolysing)
MCGIAGILSREVAIDKKAICHHMTEALAHRGPDHLEVYADDLLSICEKPPTSLFGIGRKIFVWFLTVRFTTI